MDGAGPSNGSIGSISEPADRTAVTGRSAETNDSSRCAAEGSESTYGPLAIIVGTAPPQPVGATINRRVFRPATLLACQSRHAARRPPTRERRRRARIVEILCEILLR